MQPFTPQSRAQLLAEYFAKRDAYAILERDYEDAEGAAEAAIEPQLDALSDRLQQLNKAYVQGLPILPLSRCPFTGAVWSHSFDPYGLDGLWWDFDNPRRPSTEPHGGKHLCFTGAVWLTEPVENTPFVSRPGPAVPFVVPRLLENPHVKAVMSQVPIGRHVGFLTVYFAAKEPEDVLRTNDWGTGHAHWRNDQGEWEASEFYDSQRTYDYLLTPWLNSGKLLWIQPGDLNLQLRTEAVSCPFVGLEGRGIPCRIRRGEVWWPTPDPPKDPATISWS